MSITDLGSAPATTAPGTTAPANTVGPKAYTVGLVEDVPPGEGRAFVAGGTQIAVFRLRNGSLHATQAACPHAGGPLADGQTDVDVLVCPLHLYAYRWSDGASASGAAPIRLFPVREVDGNVVVEA
jgi:nitrite reductase (NADH) small subunit